MAYTTSDTEPMYMRLCAHMDSLDQRLAEMTAQALDADQPGVDQSEVLNLINVHANVATALMITGQALYGDELNQA